VSDPENILSRVTAAVAESLAIDPSEVESSQRFFVDIGGESIEWLDLSFRLDKEFGVRIPGIGNFTGAETDDEGRFTPAGIAALRAFLPESLISRVRDVVPSPTAKELAAEITVADIAGMVAMALGAKKAVPSP
jgi:acyl carrier protein